MTETEEQTKDRHRMARYIAREELVSVMNQTKWERLQALMQQESYRRPPWRAYCLRDAEDLEPEWDYDWHYHLPPFKSIVWLEINPIQKERRGQLLPDKLTDNTDYLTDLLKTHHIPFSIEGQSLRVWGYLKPGQAVSLI